jgi:hypothetical protein
VSEPAPITWDGSTVYTYTNFNTEFRDALQWLLGHSSNPKPYLRTRGASPTALANGSTWTNITLGTTVINRGFATPNPATIPVSGHYDIGATIDVDVAVSNKALRIRLNGTSTLAEDDQPGVGGPVPARITCSTGVVPLSAGDVITIEGFNDSAAASVDALSTGEWAPVLWIQYIATAS